GGTSLSKVWRVIPRFSEDIDIAVDRSLFGIEGDVTKRQLKKLRKTSSVFVRDTLAKDLKDMCYGAGLAEFVEIHPEPDGDGDATYPEPRRIHIGYKSVLSTESKKYLRNEVQLEVGSRSLLEPTAKAKVDSFVTEAFPHLTSSEHGVGVVAAVAEKTFLEKVFLLHELFTTNGCKNANRKSRHLYDLYKMMDAGISENAIVDDKLWETIRHHREVFTSVQGVDYTPDVRKRLCIIPRKDVMSAWEEDYDAMAANMIYEEAVPSFATILESMAKLEAKFHTR
ncbi:MAG: nucleotidyl transferase AbiEii/AbiGii toxin family protein, partial [Bacteroidales bacterium]|nr:nucleotidyl transferase AbiEii/AbiGii toxin family protein [Bacteroidales bacterium]